MATRRSEKSVWTPEDPRETQELATAKTAKLTVGFITM